VFYWLLTFVNVFRTTLATGLYALIFMRECHSTANFDVLLRKLNGNLYCSHSVTVIRTNIIMYSGVAADVRETCAQDMCASRQCMRAAQLLSE